MASLIPIQARGAPDHSRRPLSSTWPARAGGSEIPGDWLSSSRLAKALLSIYAPLTLGSSKTSAIFTPSFKVRFLFVCFLTSILMPLINARHSVGSYMVPPVSSGLPVYSPLMSAASRGPPPLLLLLLPHLSHLPRAPSSQGLHSPSK